MNLSMFLAVALVIIESVTTAAIADARIFAVATAATALSGLRIRQRIRIPSWMLFAGFAAVITTLLLTAPADAKPFRASILFPYVYAYACAQALILAQLARFYLETNDQPVTTSVHALLGIVAMAFLGYGFMRQSESQVFHALALGFAMVVALYFAACQNKPLHADASGRRTRAIVFTVILAGALSCGFGMNLGMAAYGYSIDQWLAKSITPPMQPQGFSDRARLDSVVNLQQDGAQTIALRVESKNLPGYLRGKVYDIYDAPEWRQTPSDRIVEPQKQAKSASISLVGANMFPLKSCTANAGSGEQIWTEEAFNGVLFSPLETAWIAASVDDITVDANNIVSRPTAPPSFHTCFPGESCPANQLDESGRRQFTALPEKLDPRIHDIAKRITAKCTTDPERVSAVLHYFANFQYSTSVNIPRGEDTLAYFLVNHTPAHCEYFASGVVVLLRAAGVPARYVTGFLTWERNDYGGYYVARNRDAHAWVETFDPAKGWITVDATPVSGLPEPKPASRTSEALDAFKFQMRQWREAFMQRLQQIRNAVADAIAGGIPNVKYIAVTGFAFAAIGYIIYRAIRRRKRKSLDNDEHAELHQMLDAMDRILVSCGHARGPNETLSRFAGRLSLEIDGAPWISSAANWYVNYCDIRYSAVVAAREIETLKIALDSIQRDAKVVENV